MSHLFACLVMLYGYCVLFYQSSEVRHFNFDVSIMSVVQSCFVPRAKKRPSGIKEPFSDKKSKSAGFTFKIGMVVCINPA